jgi:protein-disulfide isomerase
MRKLRVLPLLCAILAPAWAADQPGITREQGDAILNELRSIRQLLEKQAAQRPAVPARPGDPTGPVKLTLENPNWLGDKNAPLTMVEFTDYQCTFCQRFHLTTFPEIRKRYIDTGKVRFLSLDFPLEFHTNATRAAQAARCAGDQGMYWEMRDTLVADSNRLAEADLVSRAQRLNLNLETFRSCLSSEKHLAAVKKEAAEAAAMGISGTPSFVIGKSAPDGVDGVVVVGALPFSEFESKLSGLGAK